MLFTIYLLSYHYFIIDIITANAVMTIKVSTQALELIDIQIPNSRCRGRHHKVTDVLCGIWYFVVLFTSCPQTSKNKIIKFHETDISCHGYVTKLSKFSRPRPVRTIPGASAAQLVLQVGSHLCVQDVLLHGLHKYSSGQLVSLLFNGLVYRRPCSYKM